MPKWISRADTAPGSGAGGAWLSFGDADVDCSDPLDQAVGWDVWIGSAGNTGGAPRPVWDLRWSAPWRGGVPVPMAQFTGLDGARPGVIHVPFPVFGARLRDAAAAGSPIPYFVTARPCFDARKGTTLYGRTLAATVDGGGSVSVDVPLGATDFRVMGRSTVNTAVVTTRQGLTRRSSFLLDKAQAVGGGGVLAVGGWLPTWSAFTPGESNILIEGTPGDSFDLYWRFPWGLR